MKYWTTVVVEVLALTRKVLQVYFKKSDGLTRQRSTFQRKNGIHQMSSGLKISPI